MNLDLEYNLYKDEQSLKQTFKNDEKIALSKCSIKSKQIINCIRFINNKKFDTSSIVNDLKFLGDNKSNLFDEYLYILTKDKLYIKANKVNKYDYKDISYLSVAYFCNIDLNDIESLLKKYDIDKMDDPQLKDFGINESKYGHLKIKAVEEFSSKVKLDSGKGEIFNEQKKDTLINYLSVYFSFLSLRDPLEMDDETEKNINLKKLERRKILINIVNNLSNEDVSKFVEEKILNLFNQYNKYTEEVISLLFNKKLKFTNIENIKKVLLIPVSSSFLSYIKNIISCLTSNQAYIIFDYVIKNDPYYEHNMYLKNLFSMITDQKDFESIKSDQILMQKLSILDERYHHFYNFLLNKKFNLSYQHEDNLNIHQIIDFINNENEDDIVNIIFNIWKNTREENDIIRKVATKFAILKCSKNILSFINKLLDKNNVYLLNNFHMFDFIINNCKLSNKDKIKLLQILNKFSSTNNSIFDMMQNLVKNLNIKTENPFELFKQSDNNYFILNKVIAQLSESEVISIISDANSTQIRSVIKCLENNNMLDKYGPMIVAKEKDFILIYLPAVLFKYVEHSRALNLIKEKDGSAIVACAVLSENEIIENIDQDRVKYLLEQTKLHLNQKDEYKQDWSDIAKKLIRVKDMLEPFKNFKESKTLNQLIKLCKEYNERTKHL